ncbi:hypothetical protein DWG24_13600 [Dickeya zeae]|uniref:HNH endonuclease n=1 Tax=Dickeya zeae TaxID=204042 RepID=A0AAE6Z1L8_9GAMM|nr:hypothetical protein [Dickeya zeae]QIZ51715.1 hypothetical protein DWG24_13600 [Dickeya zeae]
MSVCIYCGQEGKVTREHILPSFIYKYQYSTSSEKTIGWQEKSKKIISDEAKIKDVCDHCNNVILSELDGYVKNMLEHSGFFTQCFLKEQVNINYNYSLISRWLLKVAFNSSRASEKKLDFFDKYKDIILGQDSDLSGFAISAGLLKPLKLTPSEVEKYGHDLNTDPSGYANPFFGRISWVEFESSECAVKQIVIGAAIFHIIAFNTDLLRARKKALIKEYLEVFKGMALIRKNESKINITQTPLTFIDSMKNHMLRREVEPYLIELSKNFN